MRQDPGHAAESAAGRSTDEEAGHGVDALPMYGGHGGLEPLTGPAVRSRAPGAEARGRGSAEVAQ
ncbi:hypothetical protein GCM10014719_64410 [Planomonospora parontospora subsp. antibiotica]|nr:hypothetical protein GCM10014719_64410 [Planomonospora parontospora subsp. antibiotica]GII19711.1 hypothetical protein Ppa05_64370 [Planomonospora parontospora subsp. antibiotica]